ncbi:2TM domain-containing protein [Glaciihabitans sp. dw_435]|uniref:2TM domain-containing protein n=1 Tax=Glaciihabitans sp. dw_435 TaxID=2720081 RepID=UPI001BD6097B|nr:2TM domain-containing protein [Glaciihabitans sp. dw_435]
MNEEEIRTLARRRLKARADFTALLWVWLVVSVFLIVIWWMTSPGGYFWPIWAILGIGVAVVFQAIEAYGTRRYITESDVDAEVERLNRGRETPGSGTV